MLSEQGAGRLPIGPQPPLPRRTLLTGGLPPYNPFAGIGTLATTPLSELLKQIGLPERRKIFVSYHHDLDQAYYNALARLCDDCDFLTDRSVSRIIKSDDPEYQERRIREEYMSGTSVTLVLCGAQTYQRKFVDWEIYATLYQEKALIGILLPWVVPDPVTGKFTVPSRLHVNIGSGYALWRSWLHLNAANLRSWTEEALNKDKILIQNWQDKKLHDG
jgi:hypothetical protein